MNIYSQSYGLIEATICSWVSLLNHGFLKLIKKKKKSLQHLIYNMANEDFSFYVFVV